MICFVKECTSQMNLTFSNIIFQTSSVSSVPVRPSVMLFLCWHLYSLVYESNDIPRFWYQDVRHLRVRTEHNTTTETYYFKEKTKVSRVFISILFLFQYFEKSYYKSVLDGKIQLERKCGKHSAQYQCLMKQSGMCLYDVSKKNFFH